MIILRHVCMHARECTLSRSHAIMKYLVGTHEELVAPHWYPRDLKTRGKVDAMLDVHHTLVRPMSAYVFNKVLGPMGGLPSDPSVLPAAEANMGRAFKVLESILKAAGAEKGRVFLAGTAEPSIADLSSACELAQAAVLEDIEERLRPFPLVRAWQGWVRDATQPHWDETHAMLNKVVAKVKEARL